MSNFGDSLSVGLIVGVLAGLGGYAAFCALKLRKARADPEFDRRRLLQLRWGFWTTGPASLLGVALLVAAVARPPSNFAEMRAGVFQGCYQGCLRTAQAQACADGCKCYVDQLEKRFSPRELNDLIIAVSRHRDASAQATLLEVAQECQRNAP